MKIMVIIGTRPEAIKLAPVVHALRRRPGIEAVVCATGQHRHLLDQALALFGITPDIDLNLMVEGQTLAGVASLVIMHVDGILEHVNPDIVLVQGDTTTAFAAGLTSAYRQIPVGHIEAGLRTHNPRAPWPEETNRCLIARVARWHFAPTERARDHLVMEGIAPAAVAITGNTIVDALAWIRARPPAERSRSPIPRPWEHLPVGRRLILATCHRRENLGDPLRGICTAVRAIADRGDVQVVFPVHPNPRVQDIVHAMLDGHQGISLVGSLEYDVLIDVLARSALVLTDSGGIQEEAAVLGRPTLVLRETTERQESLEAGSARLVGCDTARIHAETTRLLDNAEAHRAMSVVHHSYGDGRASERIADILGAFSAQNHAPSLATMTNHA